MQIFKYVKSIWPNYAGEALGTIDMGEAISFFNEQLGPLVDPDYKKGTEVFSDEECREMFLSIDKKKDQALEKHEMASFLCRFINNKDKYIQNSEFILKLKELRSHIDQEVQ